MTFDSFNAAWTEDAADKLIMLKSEGWYRGAMNMISVPFLNRVELQQDKGDNAILWIWNERVENDVVINEAGVFAGEVLSSDDAPEPGTFVEKPDDFAYFMWGAGTSVQSLTLTTTLYPIEVVDQMDFSASLVFGGMSPIPKEALDMGASAISANLETVLFQIGPYDEALDMGVAAVSANLETVLFQIGPYDEALDVSVSAISANLTTLLVSALMPDEGIDFSVALISGSMTPV